MDGLMKEVSIGLLVLNLSLSGVGLWQPQSSMAQIQVVSADILELEQILKQSIQQLQQGNYLQAIITLQQLLAIARRNSDKKLEVTALTLISLSYQNIDQPQKALEYYNQVLPITREVKDRKEEAGTLYGIGEIYNNIGQPQKALEYNNQALPITREVKDRNGEGKTLFGLGIAYSEIGQPQKALEYYDQALRISREVKNKHGEARVLYSIGTVYSNIGQPQKALEFDNQALSIAREFKDLDSEGSALNNIGVVHSDIGQSHKALEYYNQALRITREVKNRKREATTLNNIGLLYDKIGQPQKALEYYNQALIIRVEVEDKVGEATTLNNIGTAYSGISQLQKALEYYSQALSISKEVKDRGQEATTLNNMGEVYDKIGQPQKALEYYKQSLLIHKEVKDRIGEAITLNNIGYIYVSVSQPQKALEYYKQSLPISREVQNRNNEATTLNNMGQVYSGIGQRQKALEYHKQSLLICKEVKDRIGEAITLNNIGYVYFEIRQPQKALEYISQSLPILKEVNNQDGEASILGNLAFLERSRGNLQAALIHIESAIKIIETVRTEIVNQNFRTSFFASKQDYYDLYIDVLMQLHKQQPSKDFNALALQASERARARGLIELISESKADIRQGVEPKLLEQEKNLQFQLNALEKRRIELYSKTPTNSQLTSFEKEYDLLLSQYQNLETKIRSNSPRYAALTQPQPLTVAELKQQVLDDNTVLLEYFLGKDRSYLWAVTPSGMTSYELPKQPEIAAATQQFRKVVANSNAQPSEITKAGIPLTKMLLAPVAKQLGQKRLLIVSNGALQYLPFAALPAPTGSQALLSNHEIINLPSASTLATLRHELNGRKPAAKTVAVFADPVFSPTDQRVSKSEHPSPNTKNPPQDNSKTTPFLGTLRSASEEVGMDFGRLPDTRQEAENILKLIPANTKTQAFDFKASRENVLNSNLSQYRIIHFATHGILNTTRPELSAVVMSLVDQKGNSQNGFLRLNDIFNLNLPAELIVLSACQTGLGQNIRGEGLIGLTRGFMYAGTPRVLVSLWNVNDESTAVLMTHFYKAMLEQKLSPAAALRAAQLKMQQEPKWKSPYYWAAFTLQGEWR
jgi:CHAT domain-containing protein/tetratricopeptide (TPR) repeat protein